ncbi:nipped-B protein isoform X1 [Lutzomyia longipalpis]|uniref:nipped-B protein isoform X1 n=1 Tax=Lutzomyia longipalpis TaxID=7200 RepID=UPI002483D759|nr:nipped-B protein isoform X1 [Lutzomyia longipalpis]
MGDKDIPSVPITTLAGLTNLSDLLSELPISDPNLVTSLLDKSLLFHPRVAEEARNLLAVQDTNRAQQLIRALEQTNTDHIEILDEFNVPEASSSSTQNNVPELLQAIYKIRPNVFQEGRSSSSSSYVQQQTQQQQQQHQQQVHQTGHGAQQQQPQQMLHHQIQTNMPQNHLNQALQHPYNYMQQPQQQQPQHFTTQSQAINQPSFNSQQSVQLTGGAAAAGTSSIVNWALPVQQQQQQQQVYVQQQAEQQQQQQGVYMGQQQPSASYQQPNIIQSTMNYDGSVLQTQHTQQAAYAALSMHQGQQQQQQVHAVQQPHPSPQAHTTQQVQQQLVMPPQQSPYEAQYSAAAAAQHSQHQAVQHTSVVVTQPQRQTNVALKTQIHQQSQGLQQQQQQQANQSFTVAYNAIVDNTVGTFAAPQQQQQQQVQPQQPVIQQQQAVQVIQQPQSQAQLQTQQQQPQAQQGESGGVIRQLNAEPLTQKLAPRNNEYLAQQQQNKNFDARGQSPAQAVDAVSVAESSSVNTDLRYPMVKNSNSNVHQSQEKSPDQPISNCLPPKGMEEDKNGNCTENDKAVNVDEEMDDETAKALGGRLAKVCLNRLTKEDLEKTLGAIPEDDSLFSRMKASERKRKVPQVAEKPDEELITKPKLRRIERVLMPVLKKLDDHELLNSNTYNHFNTTMEKIFDQLDETEANLSFDDCDDNYECISTALLNSISAEAAKLKAKGSFEMVPQNKLSLLITYAMRSVVNAKNLTAGPDMQEEPMARSYTEKIVNALEASLLICNIYSCLSVKFLQEDNLDFIIKFVQFQLRETIFPSYDPVYSVETKKKGDTKKKKTAYGQVRGVGNIYSKIVDLTKVLVTIFSKFQFEDTIVIHASAIGVEPFFVDNIDTMQFVCLDLVTTIFKNEKYSKHRNNILGDILTSLDRLHGSKKMLRPYKLANNGGNIQMVTALVLQLIQCSVVLPDSMCEGTNHKKRHNSSGDQKPRADKDLFVSEKYETAKCIGGNFLQTFLSKCKPRSGETDFRPLFENFIQDLLTTVNKPEWPAAELLLSLLGRLLYRNMSDKSVEQSIRLVSLEYLGLVAARLRKDTVESRCKVSTMDQLIKYIKIEQEKEGDVANVDSIAQLDPDEERVEFLQKILLDFLAVNAHEDNIWDHARHFYLTQWYRDIMNRKKEIAEGKKGYATRKTPKKKRRNNSESTESDDDDESDDDVVEVVVAEKKKGTTAVDQELNLEIFRILDQRKKYLINNIKSYSLNSFAVQDVKTYIDYNNAQLIAQYLSSRRSFSQSFDLYLRTIINVVWEQSIAIRTKAIKCLGNIVEVDPSILKRKDMQIGVNNKFLDQSIAVREAAVDLIGKYVLTSPELINQYYETLSFRILDTGVSVRKRVIKILRDICLEYPDFEKIPEICVKMIRRVNDEEGIQKLVTEVFLNMWFSPCNTSDKAAIERKITQITDVVSFSFENTQWLDGLLRSIFKPKENKEDTTKTPKEPPKQIVTACEQIADGLVDAIMKLEGTDSRKLLGCITTVHLFAKIRPQLLVKHAITLEPYLNIKCNNSNNMVKFMSCVAEILEHVVPLMEHPSDSFLADLEAHLTMLIVTQSSRTVVSSCISCLGAIANKLTKNYALIRDCFKKFFYPTLVACKEKVQQNPSFSLEMAFKSSSFRRSIFIVGLLMRYFDFNIPEVYGEGSRNALPAKICDEVFNTFMFYVVCNNLDIRKEILNALGYFCVKNYEYLTMPELKDFYRDLLTSDTVLTEIKVTVVKNILLYLNEEDLRMDLSEKEWESQAKKEDLKEMGDQKAGMASRVIQLYLKEIMNCFLCRDINLRIWSMKVVDAVLTQGLVHPIQIVPYLICLSTDSEGLVSNSADRHLQDIEKQYPGFINMKAQSGIQLSYDLQQLLQVNEKTRIVRGFREKSKDEPPSALTGFLYTLLRNAKPQRRALIQSIIKRFDDQRINLRQMLYLSDNLAYYPYAVQDEPLYIIHQIDVVVTVTGTNLLSNFREGLKQVQPENPAEEQQNILDDDDDDDKEAILSRLPEDLADLQNCITSAQGCMLLLLLKQHLKDCYGITDSKINRYSPSEPAKIYEKAMQKRAILEFNPKSTIDLIKEEDSIEMEVDENVRKKLVDRYLDFKQLMLKLDPEDSDDDDDTKPPMTTVVDFEQQIDTFGATPHVNNVMNNSVQPNAVNNVVNSTNQQPSFTQSGTDQHATSHQAHNQVTTKTPIKATPVKKPPPRKAHTKKKKKIVSSSEEEDYDNSDSDYL